jgi:hypothetical protein
VLVAIAAVDHACMVWSSRLLLSLSWSRRLCQRGVQVPALHFAFVAKVTISSLRPTESVTTETSELLLQGSLSAVVAAAATCLVRGGGGPPSPRWR